MGEADPYSRCGDVKPGNWNGLHIPVCQAPQGHPPWVLPHYWVSRRGWLEVWRPGWAGTVKLEKGVPMEVGHGQ